MSKKKKKKPDRHHVTSRYGALNDIGNEGMSVTIVSIDNGFVVNWYNQKGANNYTYYSSLPDATTFILTEYARRKITQ